MYTNLLVKTVAFACFAALSACATQTVSIADRVFTNGGVYTVDGNNSWHEAVAIGDGEILFVGSNEAVKSYIGERTEVVDLTGKMLMPGFHDAHAHILDGGASLNTCDLQDSADANEIRTLLIQCLAEFDYGPEEWVVGSRWALTAFDANGPRTHMLDDVLQGRPAVFVDSFGHNSWVSSRALELAGIDEQTKNPDGGIIVRDPASGKATGTLRESAMGLVSSVVPIATTEQRQANLAAGLEQAARFGITAFIEPGIKESELLPYVNADKNGTLTSRVLLSLSTKGISAEAFGDEIFPLLEKRASFAGKYLSANSVKVFMDGVIETHTSYMLEPYTDTGKNFDTFYTRARANELYQKLDAIGIQIHTHAIGDGSIRTALNAYEHAIAENGKNDNRHHIVHLQLIDQDDIPRFGELNVAANFQALWAWKDQYYDLAKPMVGQSRVDSFYPIKSVADHGGLLVGGSDWAVSSLNPLDAIEVAVRRQDPMAEDSGSAHNEKERVALAEMIAAYTRNGAWLMSLEDKTGTIEVGKRADLIVLDKNLFEIPIEDINSAKVLLTLMDGRVVFSAE